MQPFGATSYIATNHFKFILGLGISLTGSCLAEYDQSEREPTHLSSKHARLARQSYPALRHILPEIWPRRFWYACTHVKNKPSVCRKACGRRVWIRPGLASTA